jgi:hypothetical protein
MKRFCFVLVTVFISFLLFGQDAPQETNMKLEISSASNKAIFGEPIYFNVKITNEGPNPAKLVICNGMSWAYAPGCKGAIVIKKLDGKVSYGQFLPQLTKQSQNFAVGEMATGIVNPDGLVLKEAGTYEIWAEMESRGVQTAPRVAGYPPYYYYSWKGHAISNTIKIEVEAPVGVDLQVYNELNGDPLNILGSDKEFPSKRKATLYNKYPTSTYAGYAMLSYGPSGSLSDASKITPEKFDEKYYVVGTPAEKEMRRKEAKQKYENFLKKARAFLSIHPDFSREALLRKEMANALFYTDKSQEAWLEVETLSKLEGESAEEARTVLSKQSDKKAEHATPQAAPTETLK